MEQRIQQERRVAGLGGHTGDARDVDVGALGAIDEVEVEVDGFVVPGESGRKQPIDAVEGERGVTFGLGGDAHRGAG